MCLGVLGCYWVTLGDARTYLNVTTASPRPNVRPNKRPSTTRHSPRINMMNNSVPCEYIHEDSRAKEGHPSNGFATKPRTFQATRVLSESSAEHVRRTNQSTSSPVIFSGMPTWDSSLASRFSTKSCRSATSCDTRSTESASRQAGCYDQTNKHARVQAASSTDRQLYPRFVTKSSLGHKRQNKVNRRDAYEYDICLDSTSTSIMGAVRDIEMHKRQTAVDSQMVNHSRLHRIIC